MRFLRDNGLTLVLMAAFLLSLCGMALTGWTSRNEELTLHGAPALTLLGYLLEPQFVSALFENWESEFLQMAAYVMLTAYLFQRGSAESRDPDDPERPHDSIHDSRWRARPILRWLYAYSLGIALISLFILSFVLHWQGSVGAANQDAVLHGRPTQTALEYLGDPQLWFESFQNWQSEFLSTAVLAVLSIVLRFSGSPESKPVGAADSDTGA